MRAPRKKFASIVLAGALAVTLIPGVLAQGFWRKKPAQQWTAEEAVKVLRESPWARQQLAASAGASNEASASISVGASNCDPDAVDANGNCLEHKLSLPRDASQSPSVSLPNFNYAAYLMRWESATPVEQAFARLAELGERAAIVYFSPPPRLPADRYVITVKALRPPSDVTDPLALREESAEKQRVRLKTSRGIFFPLESERAGVGAGAAVHFFFPRERDGKPVLAAPRDTAEFVFEGLHVTLKGKFSLDAKSIQ